MTEFELMPNGDISGYKTDFIKQLTNDKSNDAVYAKYIGIKLIAFCFDTEGHICNVCDKKVFKFIEIPLKGKNIICSWCLKRIHNFFEELT